MERSSELNGNGSEILILYSKNKSFYHLSCARNRSQAHKLQKDHQTLAHSDNEPNCTNHVIADQVKRILGWFELNIQLTGLYAKFEKYIEWRIITVQQI